MNIKELKDKYKLRVYERYDTLHTSDFWNGNKWYTLEPFRRVFYKDFRSGRPYSNYMINKSKTGSIQMWFVPSLNYKLDYEKAVSLSPLLDIVCRDEEPDYALLCDAVCTVVDRHWVGENFCTSIVDYCNYNIFRTYDVPTILVDHPFNIPKDESTWRALATLDGTIIYFCQEEGSGAIPKRYIAPEEAREAAVVLIQKRTPVLCCTLFVPNWDVDFKSIYEPLKENFTNVSKTVLKWD